MTSYVVNGDSLTLKFNPEDLLIAPDPSRFYNNWFSQRSSSLATDRKPITLDPTTIGS